jgi:putative DNA primase/helicase
MQELQVAKGDITFPDKHHARVLSTIRNLRTLLKAYNITVRYNVIGKDVQITIPNKSFTCDNYQNAALSSIRSAAALHLMPLGQLDDYILSIAEENVYNPVVEWIESKPWDGIDRIEALLATVEAENEEAKNKFIYRWLISAVAAAYQSEGIDAAGILVFQGDEGLGKTWWLRKLCPAHLGLIRAGGSLNPHDKDSVHQALGHWILELGELDGIMRRTDREALKNFITRDYDIMRLPYARKDSRFPRRTVFFASVNPRWYLADAGINRRYWTVACTKVNSYHDIDMQQVWAQIKVEYDNGETYKLKPEEFDMVKAINNEHTTLSPIKDMLLASYKWEDLTPYNARWLSATEIMREMDFKNPTKSEVTECSLEVGRINGNHRKHTGKGRVLAVPPLIKKTVF